MYPTSDLMVKYIWEGIPQTHLDDWQPYSQITLLSPLFYKMISS